MQRGCSDLMTLRRSSSKSKTLGEVNFTQCMNGVIGSHALMAVGTAPFEDISNIPSRVDKAYGPRLLLLRKQ